jgi:hypothetical protein
VYSPIPITPALGTASHLVRIHLLRTDFLRSVGDPIPRPLRDVGAVSTNSILWALVCITVWASVVGVAIALAARRPAHSPTPTTAKVSLPPQDSSSHRFRRSKPRAA